MGKVRKIGSFFGSLPTSLLIECRETESVGGGEEGCLLVGRWVTDCDFLSLCVPQPRKVSRRDDRRGGWLACILVSCLDAGCECALFFFFAILFCFVLLCFV